MDLDVAVIGLDGSANWRSHHDIHRQDRLVARKVTAARDSDRAIEFRGWIARRN